MKFKFFNRFCSHSDVTPEAAKQYEIDQELIAQIKVKVQELEDLMQKANKQKILVQIFDDSNFGSLSCNRLPFDVRSEKYFKL